MCVTRTSAMSLQPLSKFTGAELNQQSDIQFNPGRTFFFVGKATSLCWERKIDSQLSSSQVYKLDAVSFLTVSILPTALRSSHHYSKLWVLSMSASVHLSFCLTLLLLLFL